jgi:hypothetical protein
MTDLTEDHITNADRAQRCDAALVAYNDEYDINANVIDLLTDIRHWCDANGHAFHELDRIAYEHYLAEATAGWRQP